MNKKVGVITTVTNIEFNLLFPELKMINIDDIAHSLSHIARANGHFHSFLSVARHCVNCAREAKARNLSPKIQLACLLHDASEAYLGDVVSPLKKLLPEFQKLEDQLIDLIYLKYDLELSDDDLEQVAIIDRQILYYEFNFFKDKEFEYHLFSKPELKFSSFQEDLDQYLLEFSKLFGGFKDV